RSKKDGNVIRTLLLECEQDDLRVRPDAHRWSPRSGSARCIYLQPPKLFQPVSKFAKGATRDPGERKYLSLVSMPAQQQAHPRLFNNRQPVGYVLRQDAPRPL